MKTVLLLTWYDNQNYGTSLQASSLRSIIQNPEITGLNYSSQETFKCDLLRHQPKRLVSKVDKIFKLIQPEAYLRKYEQLKDHQIMVEKKDQFAKRASAFSEFTKTNLTFSSKENCQTADELRTSAEAYDIIMSGSDQVWNPEALDPTYLLQWVPINKRKISYGSSLSTTTIPEKYYELFKCSLSNFDFVSIRDTQCREQLSQIIGKEIHTVVDPVILLGRKELALKQKPIGLGTNPYIFCYFLGNNISYRKMAIKFAKEHSLDIKAIIHCGSNFAADKDLERYAVWDVNPNQFISYINNSVFVFTDSFHATVISTLLHKEFVVFEKDSSRPTQNTRVKEFLELAKLDERWEMSMPTLTPIDSDAWKLADKRIDDARQKSFDYLMEALNNE